MKGVAASRPSVILLRASVIVWPRRPKRGQWKLERELSQSKTSVSVLEKVVVAATRHNSQLTTRRCGV